MSSDRGRRQFTEERVTHWNRVAAESDRRTANRAYHARLAEVYGSIVPAGRTVLELGSGRGDLLAAMRPRKGVGVDFSPGMLQAAHQRHPELLLVQQDAHEFESRSPFDYVILSDLITDVWDVQQALATARAAAKPSGRVVLNFYSHLWGAPLALAQRLGLSSPRLDQSWLTVPDVRNLLRLAGLELVQHRLEVLWPLATPLIAPLLNRVFVKAWPFSIAALTHVVVARPAGTPRMRGQPTVSVVIPARNEAGNVPDVIRRTPDMGASTELIFVEGHSADGTYEAIERAIADNPRRRCQVHRQTGIGKGDAVRLGFSKATGDVLMILDADMTVAPEELPKFVDVLLSGAGEFVNGVRLVYPMGGKAMRAANLVGNKGFSWLFSWLLGQPIRDTLCGTKVLWREDYQRIDDERSYFGEFDPFGDFDLLFGAARFCLQIVEMPIRYRDRQYGSPNIRRWRDGTLLLRMSLVAARKLKCV